jgi:hypothetical protein
MNRHSVYPLSCKIAKHGLCLIAPLRLCVKFSAPKRDFTQRRKGAKNARDFEADA